MYHFWVTVTLTSDLVLEESCPEHISYILRYESQICCVDASWDEKVSLTIIKSL